jgi:hypothetical protein
MARVPNDEIMQSRKDKADAWTKNDAENTERWSLAKLKICPTTGHYYGPKDIQISKLTGVITPSNKAYLSLLHSQGYKVRTTDCHTT